MFNSERALSSSSSSGGGSSPKLKLEWPHTPTFRERVITDMRQADDQDLRHPDMLESWRRMLTCILADLDSQLGRRKLVQQQLEIQYQQGQLSEPEYLAHRTKYLGWRRNALFFRLSAITRLGEANELLSLTTVSDLSHDLTQVL